MRRGSSENQPSTVRRGVSSASAIRPVVHPSRALSAASLSFASELALNWLALFCTIIYYAYMRIYASGISFAQPMPR